MLSDQQLALLHTRFVVPVITGQILRGNERLDDVTEYGFNTVLSDLEQDTALLCIALCAQNLSAHCGKLPAARMLRIGADKIVEDYGALWLATDSGTPVDEDHITTALSFIPEDLEAMAHLLEATLADLPEDSGIAAKLCDLLAAQATAHIDIAERKLEQHRLPVNRRAAMKGNVIEFPTMQRA
jgi:hypothetical protein